MRTKYVGIIIVGLLVVVGGYFLLRGGYQAPASAPDPTSAPTVASTEFSFSPASLNVKAGERVKITFRNSSRAVHNLVIEGLEVGTKTIGGGQADVVEFTAPSLGTYTFFCSVPGHRASGMKGSLKVQ